MGTTSGRHNPLAASEFIFSLIRQLASYSMPESVTTLMRLKRGAEDGYTDWIMGAIAEPRQRIAEPNFLLLELKTISSVIWDAAPRSTCGR